MLLNVPLKKNEVVSLKLVSGEEIIGRLVEELNEAVTLTKVLSISLTAQGVGMMPFMFSAEIEKEIKINANHIISKIQPTKHISDQYIHNTTDIRI